MCSGPMSLLHYASRAGHLAITDTLLQSGADVNHQGNHGKSPLHEASRTGAARVVSLLLSYGADVNAQDRRGRTPLHYAANHEVAAVLLGSGAKPDFEDDIEMKSKLAAGRIEAWSTILSRRGGRRWLRDGAYNKESGMSSSDDETSLSKADWGSRERDLETNAVQMMKESLEGSERLGKWLETFLLGHQGATSGLQSRFSKRPIPQRRSEDHLRHPCRSGTVINQDTPGLSSSRRYYISEEDLVSLRTPSQATSERTPPPTAKVARRHAGRVRSFGDKGGRDKRARRNCKFSWTTRRSAVCTRSPREGWQSSPRKGGTSGSREDEGKYSLGCSDGGIVGADRSDRDIEGDPAERVISDLRGSWTTMEESSYSGDDGARNLRLAEHGHHNRHSASRTKPGLLDGEIEWILAHRLVRCIRAAMEVGDSYPSRSRDYLNTVGREIASGRKGPACRWKHNRSTATQPRQQEGTNERERGRARAGGAGTGCGKLRARRGLHKAVYPDGARHEESHAFRKVEGTMGETETPLHRLLHDYCQNHHKVGTGYEACYQKKEPKGAESNGTPRKGSLEGDWRREIRRMDGYGGMFTAGDGGGGPSDTGILGMDQVLLSSVKTPIRGCGFFSTSTDSRLPETAAKGGMHMDATKDAHAALHRDTSRGSAYSGDGGKHAWEENLEKTTRNGVDPSSGKWEPAGGTIVVATRECMAIGELTGKADGLPEPTTVAAPADLPGMKLPTVQQLEGQRKLGQLIFHESDAREVAQLRPFPKKSVVDQLRDLSERLTRICVLPGS